VAFGDLSLNERLVAVIVGSILYRLVLLAVLRLGFSTNDLNLISAIVLAVAMMLPRLRRALKLDSVIKKGVTTHD